VTEPTPPSDPQPTPVDDITPVHVPMLRIVEIGIAVWAVALVVTLLVPALHEPPREWWPWTCVAGIVLGAIGWVYVRRGRGNAQDAT
jgi:hypothetical protein